ncbi:hypothetical protein V8E51_000592 [Hyaloscypha variabilis]
MQFQPILALAGLLASWALADPNPQSPQQTAPTFEVLESEVEMVATQTDFLSIISSLFTNTAALASVTAFCSGVQTARTGQKAWGPDEVYCLNTVEASVSKQLRAGQTVGSDYLDSLPSGVQPFFASIVNQEYAILDSNGFTSLANYLPATGTSTAVALWETGGLRVASAVAVGLVGAVMTL